MERIKQGLREINWRNVLKVFVIGLIGFILGTISNMIYTYRYLKYLLIK